MDKEHFHTLAGPGEGLLRERASRFLGYAFPVTDEQDFKAQLTEIGAMHHTCRHVCYAYVLGMQGEVSRSTDAGEPSGTAGRPILRQIQGRGLSDCAVIVVRYFGGTLLGKGGLVRAYGTAAKLALDKAPTASRVICTRLFVRCGYDVVERIREEVMTSGGTVLSSDFATECSLVVDVPQRHAPAFMKSWKVIGAATALADDHGK